MIIRSQTTLNHAFSTVISDKRVAGPLRSQRWPAAFSSRSRLPLRQRYRRHPIPRTPLASANLVPSHESLHFLEANGAIVVGIHRLEDALVRRLKLLK